MKCKLIYILPVLSALILAGCNPVRNEVEKSVAKSMPDIIGPADSYSARIYGPTPRMMRGRLDRLDITGHNVKFSDEMTVSQLDVSIFNLEFDKSKRTVKKAGTTTFAVTLTEEELTRYLKKKYPDVPGLEIGLGNDLINITAKPGVSIMKVPIQAGAELEVHDGHILALNLKKLKVAGIGTPQIARDYISSRLKTVFDTDDLGFNANLKSAKIGKKTLTLCGDLDLMKLIEKHNAETK